MRALVLGLCIIGLTIHSQATPITTNPDIYETVSLTTTTPSTVTSYIGTGICENQEVGTLLPYPGICSLYIVCEENAPITNECGEGMEFNADLKTCQLPEEAGCSVTTTFPDLSTTTFLTPPKMSGICRAQEEGDLLPYPGDCSKYIICENPIPIAGTCGIDLHFNADLGVCDETDSDGCSNGIVDVTTRCYPPDTASPGMTGLCMDQQEGDFIAYPENCSKYIRCENPVPIAQTCKPRLYFNEVLRICDTSDSANCPDSSTTENDGGTTTVPTTTSPKPPALTGLCRDQEPSDLIPYPDNCSKYISCESPIPIAISCQDGLDFNAKLQICDDPEVAECETTPSTATPTPSPSGNICCGLSIGALVPYPDDCSQYIRCEYPIPTAQSCPDGEHFNADAEKCESAQDANCQWYTTTMTTTEVPQACGNIPNGGVFPYDGDCTKYNLCSNGFPITLPCPVDSVFNEDTGGCIPGTTCLTPTTTPAPLTCATQPNGALLPYDGDCKKYYYCSGGIAITLLCPIGSVFSEDAGGCILGNTCPTEATTPAPLTCATQPNGVLLPYEGDCKKYIFCSMGAAIVLPCPVGSVFSEETGACITGTTCSTPTTTPAPLTCATQPNGALLPYDGDCKKYNYCSGGIAITLPCPIGSVFSEDERGCILGNTCPTEATTPAPLTCATQPNGVLLPYEGDCKKYIFCSMGAAIVLPCPVDSVFSEETGACITGTTCSTPTTTKAPLTCATQPNGTLLPYDGDCKKYNYCSMGASITLPCPVDSIFSEDAGSCIAGTTCPI